MRPRLASQWVIQTPRLVLTRGSAQRAKTVNERLGFDQVVDVGAQALRGLVSFRTHLIQDFLVVDEEDQLAQLGEQLLVCDN